ncbi:MAG TPA: YkgJ family cysteine cluster protein, partial [Thermoanaerobaculia bacterium]|nr:YkgJ family cysteine cluster protein [Thermoanaerobaculia bacterium]
MSRSRDVLNAADRFFEQVASDQPAALACRAGCTLCCHGPFELSAADVPVISEGLDRLDPSIRAAIVASAEQIVAATAHPSLRECTPEQKEEFFRGADDVACPALGADGRCQIYESRPLLCRTFGLPIREGETFKVV